MKKLFRSIAEFAACHLGLSRLPFAACRLVHRRHILTAFVYHRVIDRSATRTFYTDYDRGLDTDVFRNHLDILRKHFRLVDLGEFIDLASGKKPVTENSGLITFDDADSEFITYALPALVERNIPAVMMAPTGFIGTRNQIWHVRISTIIMAATQAEWEILRSRVHDWPQPVADILRATDAIGPVADRRPLCRSINFALDRVHHSLVDQMVITWENLVRPAITLPIWCMDWEQLKHLEAHGVDVESHTEKHYKLTMVSDADLRCELVNSKHQLEARLGKCIRAIAYPQGRYEERVGEAAAAAGYQIGFTTVRTFCPYPRQGLDMFAVPRIDIHGDTRPQIDLHLARIGVQCLLKIMPW